MGTDPRDFVGMLSTHPSGSGEPRAAPEAGSHVGRFRIVGTIGAGGMGVVYLGHDDELQRRVAIKLVRPDAADARGAQDRLTREAQALARLSHPGIVTIYEVGRRGGVARRAR